jgi:hypothetical protein
MLAQGRGDVDKSAYARHRPEQTLLYPLVEAHCIDIEVCSCCGGSAKGTACIEDPETMPDKAGQELALSQTNQQGRH